MKFIISAFADESGKTIEEQIAAVKRNGFSMIEPRGINGKNISDFTETDAKELKKILDDNGVSISSIGSPFGKIQITEDFEPHFEKFKRCVENACILGTDKIRMFSFYFTNGQSHEQYRDEVFERLEKMCDYSKKSGVWCCHENEKGIYGDTVDRCYDILTTLDGKIKGIFDPANFIQCGQEILPGFEKLGKYIEYLHVKDALYSDGSVVPAGKGDGKIKELLSAFAKDRDSGILTLEPHLTVFDGLASLEQKGGTYDKLKNKYSYSSNSEAFDAACSALFEILDIIKN